MSVVEARRSFSALLAELTRRLPLIGLDAGRIRSHLERLGIPIGANDLWIAAQA